MFVRCSLALAAILQLALSPRVIAQAPQFVRVATVAASDKGHDLFKSPQSVAVVKATGDIIVADTAHHRILRISVSGAATILAGTGKPGLADGGANSAQFKSPSGVAIDDARRIVYVADTGNHLIRAIALDTSLVTTLAGSGRAEDKDGTGSQAGFKEPSAMAIDAAGTLVVADTGNARIKQVTPAGTVTTIAGDVHEGFANGTAGKAQFKAPQGIAVGPDGAIYIADTKNNAIRKLQNGMVSTIAGTGHGGLVDGSGSISEFKEPQGLASDEAGNLYIADSKNDAIRRLTTNGQVTTIAGSGKAGFADGGLDTALFREPDSVAFAGALLVSDSGNDAIRRIDASVSISGIEPHNGAATGVTPVRVFGTGFVPGATTVTFGVTSATSASYVSSVELMVTAPALPAGIFDVTVTTPGGSATLPSAWATAPPPTIAAISLRKGSIAGGALVTITGTNFTSGAVVKFGAATATSVTVMSSNALTAIVPSNPAGMVDVSVTTNAGTAIQPAAFTYFAPPTIASFTPSSGAAGTIVTIIGNNFDLDPSGDRVLFGAIPAAVSTATPMQLVVAVPPGATTGRITITTAGGTVTSTSDFSTATPIALTISAPVNTVDAGTSLQLNAIAVLSGGGGNDVSAQALWTRSGSAGTVSSTGLVTTTAAGALDITATYNGLTASFHLTVNALVLPPDPAVVAPPLNPTIVTPFVDGTSFLYSGPNPIQHGLVATMDPVRVGVSRGRVVRRDGTPVPGVRVTVLQHPEYGNTLTRADGMFDLALSGGTTYTLAFEKNGYLPMQRQLYVPWQNYVVADDAVMVQLDPAATLISSNAAQVQVVRGTTSTDANGDRRATMLFAPGTTATMLVNGVAQPLDSLTIRATEYTIGASGPKAMPAPLPPTSGYTYCVELSADEAIAAGATSVQFSKPVPFYIENFLGFPVGAPIPLGWYDRQRGAWSAAQNGIVIKILSITNGKADIDSRGFGSADDVNRLTALGVDDGERQQLATLYTPGQTLWRMRVPHFTTWDGNVPVGPPNGAKAPNNKRMRISKSKDDACRVSGSIIECENQVLGEVVPITGTALSLVYSSARAKGLATGRKLEIPASDESTLPATLKRIEVTAKVAGKVYTQILPPLPLQTANMTWDGTDAYGRVINGAMPVTATVSYVYDGVSKTADIALGKFSFADYGSGELTQNRARAEVSLNQSSSDEAVNFDAAALLGLGGWSLSAHHVYDPTSRRLLFGDGTQRTANVTDLQRFTLTTVAGENHCCFTDTSGLATHTILDGFMAQIAVGSDGSIYTGEESVVRRVGRDGSITTIAGTGVRGYSGDGGPATGAQINVVDIAIGPDDAIYIADQSNRIRRIKDGIITTVAGNGHNQFDGTPRGDGGPAVDATVSLPAGVAVGADGSIYIVTQASIRRVAPDGMISTVAGILDPAADADSVRNNTFAGSHLAVAPDGTIYYGEGNDINPRVRKITTDGRIVTVAGRDDSATVCNPDVFGGDGGLATQTCLQGADYVAVDRDGVLYIAELNGGRVRAVTADGIIKTVAGTGVRGGFGKSRDGGIAAGEITSYPWGITTGPDGAVYFFDADNILIRRLDRALPGYSPTESLIPSEDGSAVYRFTGGRHTATVDAMTGASLLTFGYDGAGRLTSMTDIDGNTTTIQRDATGAATAIVAPGGQVTKLSLGNDGYLARIENPSNEARTFTYTDGLLRSMNMPSGSSYHFDYDADGRLLKDSDAATGFTQLTRSGDEDHFSVLLGTAGGHNTTHLFNRFDDGSVQRTIIFPTNLRSTTTIAASGVTTVVAADGTRIVTTPLPDPRFGIHSPLQTTVITTPSGLSQTIAHARVVQLANERDPLSLTKQTDTLTINGKVFRSVYDAVTGRTTFTTPAGRIVTTTLDAAGRATHIEIPNLAPIDVGYSHGLLSSITEGSRTLSMSYDAQLRPTSMTAGGRTVQYAYDDAGRLTHKTLPNGGVISFSYDGNGNLASITPPGRPAHAFTFTPLDLTASYTPPPVDGTGPTSFRYNNDRQLTEIDRPDGSSIALGYDGAGRLGTLTFPGDQWTFAYNGSGRLASAAATDATVTYAYDGSLLTRQSWSGAVSGSVSMTYGNDFAPLQEAVNEGNPVLFAYDADHFMTKAGEMTLTRDPANALLISTTLASITTAITYEPTGEPSSHVASQAGNAIFSQQFVRDAAGRIVKLTESEYGTSTVFEYGYDNNGRLTFVKQDGFERSAYTYDSNGNRTSNGATYDDQDRLLTYGSATFAYTSNGELRSKTDPAGTTTYSYDGAGALRHVAFANGVAIDYLIDAQGRRVGKKLNGTLIHGWLYSDQLRIVAETDGSGAVTSRFVYASRTNVPDYMVKDGVTYCIISDHLGSPRIVLDATTGTIAEMLGYDEFGNVTNDTNPGFQPFGFAGGLYDADAKLYRFGARDYDPQTGRWTLKEPAVFEGLDPNLFSYAFGDPINFRDENGRWAIVDELGGAAIGGLVSAGAYVAGQAVKYHGFKCLSWKDVGVAAGVGFVAGFFATDTFGTSIAIGASSNVAQYVGIQVVHGRSITAGGVFDNSLSGALGGAIARGAAAATAALPENVARGTARLADDTHPVDAALNNIGRNALGSYVSDADPDCGCDK